MKSQRLSRNFPNRIVDLGSVRMQALDKIVTSYLDDVEDDKQTYKKIMCLLLHKAYARIFPNPSQATDVLLIPNDDNNPELQNCVALVIVKGQLATIGGFNDIGEAPSRTAAREAAEEAGATNIINWICFGERSQPHRSYPRGPIISTLYAGEVEASDLRAGDDAEKLYIVPLLKNGKFNTDILKAGIHQDARGERSIVHNGMRDDHVMILHQFVQRFHRSGAKSFTEMLRKESAAYNQEWFALEPQKEHKIERVLMYGCSLPMTHNIEYALRHLITLFSKAHVEDSEERGWKLVDQLIDSDLLPLFPQAAATTDAVIVSQNKLLVQVVQKGKKALFALPGSFYSPDSNEGGTALEARVRELILAKLRINFQPLLFLGSIGGTIVTGELADKRYPRITYPYIGVATGLQTMKIDPPTRWIPLFDEEGNLSEVFQDDSLWLYGHNREIIEGLFYPWLTANGLNGQGTSVEDALLQLV